MKNYKHDNLMKLVQSSQRWRQNEAEPDWKRNLSWYKSNYHMDDFYAANFPEFKDKKYSVNLAYAVVETILSATHTRFPDFSFHVHDSNRETEELMMHQMGYDAGPRQHISMKKFSRSLEETCKKIGIDIKIKNTNRQAITDAILLKYGVVKLGYKINKDNKAMEHLNSPEELAKIGLTPNDLEVSDIIKSESPYDIRIDPRRVLFPPDAEWGRWPWICIETFLSKEEAEKKYKKTIKATHSGEEYRDDRHENSGIDYVKLYEFHSFDPDDPRVVVFTDDELLGDEEYPLVDEATGQTKSLIKVMWFNEPIDGGYPQCEIDLVAPQLKEANMQYHRRVENAKKFTTQYQFSGNYTPDQIEKFVNNPDGGYIHATDHRSKVGPVEKLSNGAEFYENIRSIFNEILEVLGLTDYHMGRPDRERKATEAQIMERAMMNRVGARREKIEDFCFEQIDTLVELLKNYMQQPKQMKTKYRRGSVITWNLTAELLQLTDMDITVQRGSTIEFDVDFEIARAERLAKIAQAFGPVINLPELAKRTFERLGEEDVDDLILSEEPQPVPLPGGDGGAKMSASPSGSPDPLQAQHGGMPG